MIALSVEMTSMQYPPEKHVGSWQAGEEEEKEGLSSANYLPTYGPDRIFHA